MSSAIRQWLEKLGLAQYGDRFEADDIDLDVVPSLSEQDLGELGVSMGHRKKLLKAIAELGVAATSTVPLLDVYPELINMLDRLGADPVESESVFREAVDLARTVGDRRTEALLEVDYSPPRPDRLVLR